MPANRTPDGDAPYADQPTVTRRQLLSYMGGLAAAVGLAGCTGSGARTAASSSAGGSATAAGTTAASGSAGTAARSGTIDWWDQFRPLSNLFKSALFDPYEKAHPGVTVKRQMLNAPALSQALTVARRSNQMPDVFTLAGLQSAPAALVTENWFQPISDSVDIEGSPVGQYLYDGIHRFDGKVYSFPIQSGRDHNCSPWLNTELLKKAGIDPDQSPQTWDEYRAALRTLTKKTGVPGIVLASKATSYLDHLVVTLAQSAGAPGPAGDDAGVPDGSGGVDWKTGAYQFDSQPYLDAMEFLVALHKDGSVHPASPSMLAQDARARWAAGQAAVYMWGSFIIGGLLVDEKAAVDRGIGVWEFPCPDKTRNSLYSAPAPGAFWVSRTSQHATVASELLAMMATQDFQRKLAGAMDKPPVLIDLVKSAQVNPAYTKNVEYLAKDVRIGPVPQVRNSAVADVLAKMTEVHPNIGEIAQGVLAGSISNYKSALSTFTSKLTAERDQAIKAVAATGKKVSVDDWVFSNWVPGKDFTPADYKA